MPALPIYTTPAMRKLEELAAPASGTLMERAGAAAAEYARSLCGDTAKSVLVLAGPGNNGGDTFEVATHLKRWFFRVNVVFSGERGKLPKDALMALEKWETAGGTFLHGVPGESRFDLAVDGLFGTGLKRPLAGAHGARGMVGAAVIAGRAALKCGAGRVYLGLLTPHPPYIDDAQPELMLRKPAAVLGKELVNVLVAGPGMGKADSARKLLRAALAASVPVVLDADALNMIAASRALAASLPKRKAATKI